jgi:hypothetical protein
MVVSPERLVTIFDTSDPIKQSSVYFNLHNVQVILINEDKKSSLRLTCVYCGVDSAYNRKE